MCFLYSLLPSRTNKERMSLSSYSMPGTSLRAHLISFHLTSATTPWGRDYFYFYVTGPDKSSDLPNVTQLAKWQSWDWNPTEVYGVYIHTFYTVPSLSKKLNLQVLNQHVLELNAKVFVLFLTEEGVQLGGKKHIWKVLVSSDTKTKTSLLQGLWARRDNPQAVQSLRVPPRAQALVGQSFVCHLHGFAMFSSLIPIFLHIVSLATI